MKGNAISKGVITAFLLLLGIVAIIGGVYLSVYIYSITLGAIFEVTSDDLVPTAVTEDAFLASNVTAQGLDNQRVIVGTLTIFNASNGFSWSLENFTVDYTAGTVLTVDNETINTGTTLEANYSYNEISESTLPLSDSSKDFIGETESSFFSTVGQVTAGAEFAGSLIPIAVILLVFGGLLVGGIAGYQYLKKKKKDQDMGY